MITFPKIVTVVWYRQQGVAYILLTFVTSFDSAISAGMRTVCIYIIYILAFRIRFGVTMVTEFHSLR